VTIRTNARLAGFTFLLYIAAGISSLALASRAHVTDVLTVVTSFCALVLGVTLYAITRGQDRDIAMLALLCRVVESVPGHGGGAVFFAVGSTLFCWLLLQGRLIPAALAWLGLVASGLLVILLLMQRAGVSTGASNWSSSITWLVWLPLLVFELALAFWFIARGVAAPAQGKPS
jgi:Domain of unknown function (DUF4386)